MSDGRTPGLDRLQALLGWWGFSNGDGNGNGGGVQPLAALSDGIARLQRGYVDAFARNIDAMLATHDRLARTAAELLRAKTINEVARVQDAIFTALSEAAATHGKNWSEFQRLLSDVMGESWARNGGAAETAATRHVPISVTPAASAETKKPETAKQETGKQETGKQETGKQDVRKTSAAA